VHEFPGYQVLQKIGGGSQASVYLGRRSADGTTVAMKIVHFADLADDERDAPHRLRREARLLQALDSPHVVRIVDLVETPTALCLVMDYLPGRTLEHERRMRLGLPDPAPPHATAAGDAETQDPEDATQPLTRREQRALAAPPLGQEHVPAALRDPAHVAWALGRGIQFARGVADLHANGCIHRDLKPANAMVVGDRVVIFDFGVARADGFSKLTRTRAPVGTPLYWSPEQSLGLGVSPRSDVFALGATIFDLLIGTSPLRSNTHRPAPRWRIPRVDRLNPAVSRSVATVLARALEIDPRDRYPDAGALVADLEQAAAGAAIRVRWSPARTFRHHRRAVFSMAGAAALLLVLFAALQSLTEPRTPAARIAEGVRGGDRDGARSIWDALDDDGEREARDRLNELLRDDGTSALDLAGVTGQALVHLAADSSWSFALTPSDASGSEVPPASDRFTPLANAARQLVAPGYTSVWIRSTSSSADRTYRFLLHHRSNAGQEPAAARPWQSVGTVAPPYGPSDWCACPPSPVQIRGLGESKSIALTRSYEMARHEVSEQQWERFLAAIRLPEAAWQKVGPQRLAWLAHPDEPPESTSDFVALVAARPSGRTSGAPAGDRPVLVSFWWAWRFATYYGYLLPTPIEWHAVAQGGPEPSETMLQGTPWGTLAPVCPPTYATEVAPVHLLDNAREWCAELEFTPKRSARSPAMPLVAARDGGEVFLDAPTSFQQNTGIPCGELAGFRPIRLTSR
jgi:hypothetical protein